MRQTKNVFAPPVKEIRHFLGSRSPVEQLKAYNNRIINCSEAEDKLFLDKWINIEPGDDAAYLDAMLKSSEKKFAIDISPIYCIANIKQIEKIHSVVGKDTKILFFARNPIDREYSQMNLHFHMHGQWKDKPAPIADYLQLLQQSSQISRSDYSSTLKNWSAIFSEKNIQVIFYDELRQSPIKTLRKILKFIGDDEVISEDSMSVNEKIASSLSTRYQTAPSELKKFLAARNLTKLNVLSKQYPEPCKAWFEQAISLVNSVDQPEENIEQAKSPDHIIDRPTGLANNRAIKFLDKIESLGDNCELGFVLRKLKHENGSLFRWAIAPPEPLLKYIKNKNTKNELYIFENLVPYSPTMVKDVKSGFCFHSKMVSSLKHDDVLSFIGNTDDRYLIYKTEKEKIDYLADKFWKRITSKDKKIYVYKTNQKLSDEYIQNLSSAIKDCSTNNILLIPEALEKFKGPELDDRGVLRATLSRFANYATANNAEYEEWFKVLKQLAVQHS